MKLRVIVMNGQRIVEAEEDGVWKVEAVGKANKLPPGIYNLYLSEQADKRKRYDGIIVHISSSDIYQQTVDLIITHFRADFYQTLPSIGVRKIISYDAQGKVA
jgi:hypothetical protein